MQVATTDKPYKLYYWSMIPGRGEFIRLVLEQGGAPYIDVGRGENGLSIIAKEKDLIKKGNYHFAPPIFELPDGNTLSQTPVITAYLAEQLDLMPEGFRKYSAMQLTETIHDMVSEIHDVHHPVSSQIVYEEQKEEAVKAARCMVDIRIPKFFGYFETSIKEYGQGQGPFMFGEKVSYVDLSLMHLLRGAEYAFPTAYNRVKGEFGRLGKLREAVMQLDKVKSYMGSERFIDFNEQGLFRHYEELDL